MNKKMNDDKGKLISSVLTKGSNTSSNKSIFSAVSNGQSKNTANIYSRIDERGKSAKVSKKW